MTYPPQQPGGPQNPHSPHPGGQYPQSGPQQAPWGSQQPGHPQAAPYGSQPGGQYPAGGPQQAGWGQPGFDPQQAGAGMQGSYGPPPKNSRTGLYVGLAIAAVVVLVGGGIGIYFAVSVGTSARSVAEDAVAELNAGDYRAAGQLMCTEEREANIEGLKGLDAEHNEALAEELANTTVRYELDRMTENDDHTATAYVTIRLLGVPADYLDELETTVVAAEFDMIKQEDSWKLCELSVQPAN